MSRSRNRRSFQYKTVIADYEGMQEALDLHGSQGWKLVSVGPDSWRRVAGRLGADAPISGIPGVDSDGEMKEYSASYYLLVFVRDEEPADSGLQEAAEIAERPNFSLPDF